MKRESRKWLSQLSKSIVDGSIIVSNLCLVAMLVIIFSNVVLRYIVKQPLFWGDEVMTYLMILMVYLGLGSTLKEGKHIRMTAFSDRLPTHSRNVLWVITSLIALGYFGYITYAAIDTVRDSLNIGLYSMVTDLPIAPWQIVMVIGLFVLLVAAIIFTIKRIRVTLEDQPDDEVQKLKLSE